MCLTPKQPKERDRGARILYGLIIKVAEIARGPPGTKVPTFVMEVYSLLAMIRVHLFLFCIDELLNHLYLALRGRLSRLQILRAGFVLCMRLPHKGIYTSW